MAPPRAPPWESSSGLGPKASPGRLHRRKCELVFFDFLGIEPSDFTDILQSRRFPGRRNSGREKEIDHRISHPAVQVAIGGGTQESHRVRDHSHFFPQLPQQGVFRGLADVHEPSGWRQLPQPRRPCPPDQQDPAIPSAKEGRDRNRWIEVIVKPARLAVNESTLLNRGPGRAARGTESKKGGRFHKRDNAARQTSARPSPPRIRMRSSTLGRYCSETWDWTPWSMAADFHPECPVSSSIAPEDA